MCLVHNNPGRASLNNALVCLHCQRPSPCNSKVGSCNCFFEACSAFTHVTRYGLHARGVAKRPFTPRAPTACCLRCRLDCYRVERTSSRAGVAPAEVQRLSRRTVTTTTRRLDVGFNLKWREGALTENTKPHFSQGTREMGHPALLRLTV